MNDVTIRFIVYFFILLFYCNKIYSSSSTVFYSSYDLILKQLLHNSTLPQCTITTCRQTRTQANFSQVNLSDENLLKLSAYENSNRRKDIASSSPYIITSTGIYRGKRVKYQNRYVDQFLGIYYGDLPESLKKPTKKRFSYSIQEAKQFSPACMQSLSMTRNLSYGSFMMHQNFHSDCLSLNIYRADLRYGEKRKAIMVFSHGGSNQLGSGSLFDGSVLASEGDIIVVTMNFRLNYHGFLSSGDNRIKGNYGLWDQLLAIEWIYENAHLYGGDPKRIVLAGHSAGAGNVMLLAASQHSQGMIRRVISQSGTGLAPWCINHNPVKLLERFSQDICCKRSNRDATISCVEKLLEYSDRDIYHLHIGLSIADDNPYPVIDNDFLNDTIDNILQSDIFKSIDFLTGVTLNEGLYFAEYHIKHFYNDHQFQSLTTNRTSVKKKCTTDNYPPSAISTTLDIGVADQEKSQIATFERRTDIEQTSNEELQMYLKHFAKLNYIEQFINANFKHSQCFLHGIKNKYELPAQENSTYRLKLFIDLVSDLMFNFHMVHCLNLLSRVRNRNASTYAYVYSHRPTSKVHSAYRDQLKVLPQAIGHFAELDYVFGVPLAHSYPDIHQNVNKNYYNYSTDEENFSRQVIRYWSNFIKTGNPNKNSFSVDSSNVEWKPYEDNHHNYLYFHLNSIHSEVNYFDTMYHFWDKLFHIEQLGVCSSNRMKRHATPFIVLFILLTVLIMMYVVWKYCQKTTKQPYYSRQSPTTLLPNPNSVST